MFTIYLTTNRRQWAISHPKLDTALAFVKHIRTDRRVSLRLWDAYHKQFII